MYIQRTVPPSAAPVHLIDIVNGVKGFFFGKDALARLQYGIREYFGVEHCFLVSSGKAALTLILRALKSLAPEKKEVLIPAYTCFSVPSSIVKADLKISLCDIDPATFDFDYKLLEETINENTLCVIPTHLFGISSDMDRINNLCRDRGVFVIEDAAQAMGVKFSEKLLGTIGDIGFFSLGRGKNITCGSGGIIVTNSDIIACAIEKEYAQLGRTSNKESFTALCQMILMGLFIHPSLYWFPSQLPFLQLGETIFYKDFPLKKLSGINAGLLRNWIKDLEKSNEVRKKNARYFHEQLGLTSENNITVPYLRLPLIVQEKEKRQCIVSASQKKGFGISTMYPRPVNEIEEIKEMFQGEEFPYAKKISEHLLTIPTHHLVSERDRQEICALFKHLAVAKEGKEARPATLQRLKQEELT